MHPIGYIRVREAGAGQAQKFHARHQPVSHDRQHYVLELLPDPRLRAGLKDLQGFSRIWLIWWFHLNQTWRPEVLPPRGPARRRGVFATRSPRRPNPLGLTSVPLLGIDGRRLLLGPCDMVDGTPVLDIKPYVPAHDAFVDERGGWTDELVANESAPAPYTVQWSALAQHQSLWLRQHWQIDLQARVTELLSRDPSPHRTRRIKRTRDGLSRIECGAWRAHFTVADGCVTVSEWAPGYPMRLLYLPGYEVVPDCLAQRAFYDTFARSPSVAPGERQVGS